MIKFDEKCSGCTRQKNKNKLTDCARCKNFNGDWDLPNLNNARNVAGVKKTLREKYKNNMLTSQTGGFVKTVRNRAAWN